MSGPPVPLEYERPEPTPPAGRTWPTWRANVVASYGAAAVVVAAVSTGWLRPGVSAGVGEWAIAFLLSPVTLPPSTLGSLVLVALGRRTPTVMHVVVPLVYSALFLPARAWFRRRGRGPGAGS